MYVGSVNPDIPGPLILGGYDRNRVLSKIGSQNVDIANGKDKLRSVLQDISIGIAPKVHSSVIPARLDCLDKKYSLGAI